jgi:8-oxo-dGTP pyrophosphatase MutT (NUDIX family)
MPYGNVAITRSGPAVAGMTQTSSVRDEFKSNSNDDSSIKASVAMILRKRGSKTEILFAKRAVRRGDSWSGDVAFPGGCAEASDRSPFDTVCREVLEEVGLDLANASRYSLIGSLAERIVPRGKSFIRLTPYVFLDKCTVLEHEYTLAEDEIACVWWTNVDEIVDKYESLNDALEIDFKTRFVKYFMRNYATYTIVTFIGNIFGITKVKFPCIRIGPSDSAAIFRHSSSMDTAEVFMLWGLSLRMLQELIEIATYKSNPNLAKISVDNYLLDWHFGFWQNRKLNHSQSVLLGSCTLVASAVAAAVTSAELIKYLAQSIA